MSIASVYYRRPQDDKYGLSLALLLNLSEIAPGAFLTSSLLTETLVESVYTRKKEDSQHLDSADRSILSFMQSNANYLQKKCHKSSGESLTLLFQIIWL